jgi:methyltransferase (TIGR00027 family)
VAATRVERTAFGAGMMRALERYDPQPLFDDQLAERLLTGWTAVIVRNAMLRRVFMTLMSRSGPGFYGAVVCRTRIIDDVCRRALDDGIDQVVFLGAGMDARSCRIPQMSTAAVWELDLPAVQEVKKAAMARALPTPPAHVRYVPIDLAQHRVGDALAGAGADLGARTLVICEAVSMYLPAVAVDELFAYAESLPPGSKLVLTYLPRAVAEDPRHTKWARRLRWRTAFHPPELAGQMAGRGLSVRADVGAPEYREQLLGPIGRTLDVFEGERIMVTDKA